MCGSGSTTNNSVSEFKPPSYTQGGWQDFLTGAQNLSSQPYQQYSGATVAPWNGTQDAAGGLIADQALNGAPDANAARGSNMAISGGNYLGNPNSLDPGQFAGNTQSIDPSQYQGNPYQTQQYTNSVIADNAQNMAQGYSQGAAADQARNANMAGAFGGGGDQAAQAMGELGLQKQIGQMANQYQLANQGQATQDYRSSMGQNLSANQANQGAYQTSMGQALGAAQSNQGDYRSGVNQMLGANQGAQGWNSADLANSQALMGVGNSQNQYVQALLNAGQQNWSNQQNYPASQLGLYQQALQAASGSSGSTIGQQTQTGTPSWVTGGLGGLAGLYGLLGNSGK